MTYQTRDLINLLILITGIIASICLPMIWNVIVVVFVLFLYREKE